MTEHDRDNSRWSTANHSSSFKMRALVKEQTTTTPPRRRQQSPSDRSGPTTSGSSKTRKPSPSRTMESANSSAVILNDDASASSSSILIHHGRSSSRFENSASEQEMRSILSEAFCQDDELKLGKIQSEIDRIELAILHNSREDLQASFSQSVRSIKSAPALVPKEGSSSEFQYSLEDGYTPKKMEVVNSSFHFPELEWKPHMEAKVDASNRQTSLSHANGSTCMPKTKDIFSSKSLDLLSSKAKSDHPRRPCDQESPVRQRRGRDSYKRQRAKSLSHLPVISERRRPAQASNTATTALSSSSALNPVKISGGQSPKPARPSRSQKPKQPASVSDAADGAHAHIKHHHHRTQSPKASPRQSSSPSIRRKRTVAANEAKSVLEARLESQPKQVHNTNQSKASSKESSTGSPPEGVLATRRKSAKKKIAGPSTTSGGKQSLNEPGHRLRHVHAVEARQVTSPVNGDPLTSAPPESAPEPQSHNPKRHRRASTGAVAVIVDSLLADCASESEVFERRHSLGGHPSQEFQLDTIRMSKHVRDGLSVHSETPFIAVAGTDMLVKSLHSETSPELDLSIHSVLSNDSRIVTKNDLTLLLSVQNSPSSRRKFFHRRASASASLADPGHTKEVKSRTSRRHLRRMSDGGGLGRAYDGIKHAVGPIVSPRKNARRASKIFKGMGHGIGMAIHP